MGALRILLVAVAATGLAVGATTAGATTAGATVSRGGDDPCVTLAALDARAEGLASARSFDADGYANLGRAFKQAAKSAPKDVKSAAKKLGKLYASVGKADDDSEAVEAYGKGLVKFDKAITQFNAYLADSCSSESSASAANGAAGSLTIDGEAIALSSARCYLQEQTAAGQKILFTGQGSGTNAAGEDVLLDVSRYDASSRFAGDDVSIDIGDVRSGNSVSLGGRYDEGAIERSGSTLRGSDLEVTNDDDLSTSTVSFELSC